MKTIALASAFLGLAAASFAQPAPAAADSQGDIAPKTSNHAIVYRIMSTDRIHVVVFQEDDLNTASRVDANGKINLPLVGPIRVYGQTLQEAQKTIEDAYRNGRFLRDPQVTVSVEDYAPREVTINGYVKQPGRIQLPIESTVTLAELIAKAGGFQDDAKGTDVRVTRQMPDGSTQVYHVDVETLIKGKAKSKAGSADDSSMLLEPNDIVYVPERVI